MDSILMYFLISLNKKFKQSNFFIYILREIFFFKIITLVLIYIDFFLINEIYPSDFKAKHLHIALLNFFETFKFKNNLLMF